MGRSWLIAGAIVLATATASYGFYLYLRPAPLPDRVIYGNGHIEATEIRIGAEVSGRVVESALVEGTEVEKGALLLKIDPTELELQRARTEAEIAAIEQDRRRAEEEMGSWRHHLRTAEIDFERYRRLRGQGTVPPQRLEQAENKLQEARGRVGSLVAELRAIDSRLEAARKGLGIVRTRLAKARITSPIAGTVLVKAVEPGEFVRPGQTVAVLVDLSRIELKVYVPEKDIGKVTLQAPARVRVDSFPDRAFPASIARVDQQAQFTPRDIHLPEERARTVFGVTLALDNPDGTLKPGMPADAWILWKSDASWPDRLFVPQ